MCMQLGIIWVMQFSIYWGMRFSIHLCLQFSRLLAMGETMARGGPITILPGLFLKGAIDGEVAPPSMSGKA